MKKHTPDPVIDSHDDGHDGRLKEGATTTPCLTLFLDLCMIASDLESQSGSDFGLVDKQTETETQSSGEGILRSSDCYL